MGRKLVKMWTNFAKTHDPSLEDVKWKKCIVKQLKYSYSIYK